MGQGPETAPIRSIVAVTPARDRHADLRRLAQALRALPAEDHRSRPLRIETILIDNASEHPLDPQALGFPEGTRVLRLADNAGGSGGFNAGIRAALQSSSDPGASAPLAPSPQARSPQAIWLLDADAQPHPSALIELVRALEDRPDASAAGSALADASGVYELGGDVDPRDGEYRQHAPSGDALEASHDDRGTREVDYHAACSLLVRTDAIRRVGLLPDLFLNGDDVAWSYHLRLGYGPVISVPTSVVSHPHPARMRTTVRAYQARNGLTNAVRFGLGPIARARRVLRDALRAANQHLLGRDDLAHLHTLGTAAAFNNPTGPIDLPNLPTWKPLTELPPECRALPPVRPAPTARSLLRWFIAPKRETAYVNARGRPSAWVPARRVVSICEDGYAETSPSRVATARRLAALAGRTIAHAIRAALAPPAAPPPERLCGPHADTLSVVVLTHPGSFDRLRATLPRLAESLAVSITNGIAPEVVIVCNGGPLPSDLLPDARLPGTDVPVRTVTIDHNAGVDAFNRGVAQAGGDVVLILDDDAWPDARGLAQAMTAIRTGATDAVAFHRRHPATRAYEWPGRPDAAGGLPVFNQWPDMGCCNLVRKDAWDAVGGYEPGFFLYRNDTDLALSLVGAGFRVRFDPTIIAWHDSASVGKPDAGWYRLATRNWVWVARRHGRGLRAAQGVFLGWVWNHRRSAASLACHLATLRGLIEGLARTPPPLKGPPRASDGRAFDRLVRLKVRLGRRHWAPASDEPKPDRPPHAAWPTSTPPGAPLPQGAGAPMPRYAPTAGE